LDILELNCGTGEDALMLAKMGHQVTATDNSDEMLSIAKAKASNQSSENHLTFQKLDLTLTQPLNKKYDIIFSNFGGLNCLTKSELTALNTFLANQLKANGECIFVVMPKFTLFEKLYRSFKSDIAIYNQRSDENGLEVALKDTKIRTYYYNPSELEEQFVRFKRITQKPIGYLPSYFNKIRFLSLFMLLDKILYLLNFSASRSDHYLLHIKKAA